LKNPPFARPPKVSAATILLLAASCGLLAANVLPPRIALARFLFHGAFRCG